jgi:proteasome lid subunit RPN8/RPN11
VTPLNVKIPARLLRTLKRLGREAFPKETCAFLLGSADGCGLVEIRDCFAPDNVADYATESTIYGTQYKTWIKQARARGQEQGLLLVGDYHTHPYGFGRPWAERQQSESDLVLQSTYPFAVYAVGVVCKFKSGRLAASIKFWGPTTPVVVEEV